MADLTLTQPDVAETLLVALEDHCGLNPCASSTTRANALLLLRTILPDGDSVRFLLDLHARAELLDELVFMLCGPQRESPQALSAGQMRQLFVARHVLDHHPTQHATAQLEQIERTLATCGFAAELTSSTVAHKVVDLVGLLLTAREQSTKG